MQYIVCKVLLGRVHVPSVPCCKLTATGRFIKRRFRRIHSLLSNGVLSLLSPNVKCNIHTSYRQHQSVRTGLKQRSFSLHRTSIPGGPSIAPRLNNVVEACSVDRNEPPESAVQFSTGLTCPKYAIAPEMNRRRNRKQFFRGRIDLLLMTCSVV